MKRRICYLWKKWDSLHLLVLHKSEKSHELNLAENDILQNKISRNEKVSKLSEESFELEIFSFWSKSKTVFLMLRIRLTFVVISRFVCFLFWLEFFNKTTFFATKHLASTYLVLIYKTFTVSSLHLFNTRYWYLNKIIFGSD